jgi:hypothetical protein
MGIGVTVGILADMLKLRAEGEEEGYARYASDFEQINVVLAHYGHALHNEPLSCPIGSWDLFSAANLHSLRRVAAHLDRYGKLPDEDSESSSRDPVLKEYYATAQGSPRHYDHLIMHSDCGGYYVSPRFGTPIFENDDLDVPAWALGSVPALFEECSRIASALELPDATAVDIWEATFRPNLSKLPAGEWLRFPRASYVCKCLIEACRQSFDTGAAIMLD